MKINTLAKEYGSTATTPWLVILIILLIFENMNFLLLYGNVLTEYTFSLFGLIVSILIILTSQVAGKFCLQFFAAVFVKKNEIGSKNTYAARTYKLVTFVQYAIWITVSIITFDVLVMSGYQTILLALTVAISYSAAAIILGLLAFKLFLWYNRASERGIKLVILSYGLMAVLTTVGCIVLVGFNLPIIYAEEGAWVEGTATEEVAVSRDGASSITTSLLLGPPYIPIRLAYFFMWIASAILLRYHSKRIGELKYWTIIGLPLVSFIIGSAYVTTIEDAATSFFSAVVIQISAVTGSLLFALAFFTIAKSLPQNNQVSLYLKTSGYGVLLLALSLLPGIIYAPFPPWGLAAWSTLALASLLYSIGIYSSALSISHDTTLRKLLRSLYIKQEEELKREQASLLETIGTAQLEQDLQKKVLKVVKEQEDTIRQQYAGIESSLTEKDMREYMEMINQELRRREKPSEDTVRKSK
jgi:hypothetical protein